MRNFLGNFYYRKYRISFEVLHPLSLSTNAYSLIRGIFGKILHDEVCDYKDLPDCNRCPKNTSCPYTGLFKIKLQPTHPLYGKYTEPPVPYILYPDLRGRSNFVRGQTFAIELTLIGKAVEYDIFLLQIVRQLGEGEGLLYHKLQCSSIETLIGDDKKSHLRFNDITPEVEQVKLNFISPLIFEIESHPAKDLPFTAFIKSLTERVSVLNRLYCDGHTTDPESNCGEITNEEYMDSFYKTEVEVKKRVYKAALIGSVAYGGQLSRYIPLIRAGEVLHLGRLANYGFGKYIIEESY